MKSRRGLLVCSLQAPPSACLTVQRPSRLTAPPPQSPSRPPESTLLVRMRYTGSPSAGAGGCISTEYVEFTTCILDLTWWLTKSKQAVKFSSKYPVRFMKSSER
eukprot:3846812-Pleurochrysis_carterae.AAC.2